LFANDVGGVGGSVWQATTSWSTSSFSHRPKRHDVDIRDGDCRTVRCVRMCTSLTAVLGDVAWTRFKEKRKFKPKEIVIMEWQY